MKSILLLAAAATLITACGSRDALRPVSAEQAPVKPAMSPVNPTPQELLTPPPIARPERQDESLSRSEERKDDRFDLPPT